MPPHFPRSDFYALFHTYSFLLLIYALYDLLFSFICVLKIIAIQVHHYYRKIIMLFTFLTQRVFLLLTEMFQEQSMFYQNSRMKLDH